MGGREGDVCGTEGGTAAGKEVERNVTCCGRKGRRLVGREAEEVVGCVRGGKG